MKKIFFAALAAVALTACVADVVTEEPTYAIDFVSSAQGTVKSTVVTSENLELFKVFAFNGENVIMPNMTVTKTASGWTYSPKKYWPVNGDVDFYGIYVDGLTAETNSTQFVTYNANVGGPLSFTIKMNPEAPETKRVNQYTVNAAAIPDVVYATAIDQTKAVGAVNMVFRHAMAQIDFQIKNSTTAGDITVESRDVHIHGLAANGTYTTPGESTSDDGITGAWTLNGAAYTEYLFETPIDENGVGVTISTNETKGILSTDVNAKCMALPQDTNVTFYVYCNIWQNGVLIFEGYKTASTTINWQEGHKYTYTFDFNDGSIEDNTIEFTAKVTEIVDGTTSSVGTPETPAN